MEIKPGGESSPADHIFLKYLNRSCQEQQEGSFAPRTYKPHKPPQIPFGMPQLPSIFQEHISQLCLFGT